MPAYLTSPPTHDKLSGIGFCIVPSMALLGTFATDVVGTELW